MGSVQSSFVKNGQGGDADAELTPTSLSDAGSSKGYDSDNDWIDLPSEEEESEGEEDDELFDERLQILQETRSLKRLADYFAHPEKKVHSDGVVFGRCYFDRPSAHQQDTVKQSEEVAAILKDMKALKKLAKDYLHPELPLEARDPTACARCYYDRASAPERESLAETEDRTAVLEEAKALKKLATMHHHPELPLGDSDAGIVCARCYFDRASAPSQDTAEEADERATILEEINILKKVARTFLHPEDPVATSGSTVFGRNYFYRASAPEQESLQDIQDRAAIQKDVLAFKKYARYFLRPEVPVVTTDSTVFGRNYFGRASAPERESKEVQLVLDDAKVLRKWATYFRHPEYPIATTDPKIFGRNYFNRPSATPQVRLEDEDERDLVLKECHRLEKLAFDFHHPEVPVTSDPHYNAMDDGSKNNFHHHVYFDMEDSVHQRHVQFDKDKAHHDEITELRLGSPKLGVGEDKPDNGVDYKFSQSPGCVMTCFADPADISSIMAPELSR